MLLCLQTALNETSIALIDHHTVLFEATWPSMRDESSTLLPAVTEALSNLGKTHEDISGVMAVLGPGSFTALRVGLSMANTIGFVRAVPLIGVTTFDYLAAGETTPLTVVVSSSVRDCFLRTPEGTEQLLTLEEAQSILATTPWTGYLIPAHQPLQDLPTYQQSTRSAGERFLALSQLPTSNSQLLIPYYLKRPNITERKTR